MKHKIIEWIKRYVPAEFLAYSSAILGAGIIYYLTGSRLTAAYAGTIADNIGYYGFLSIREIYQSKKHHKKENKKYNLTSFLKNIKNLLVEFGPAELLDFFIIRPFCMYLFPILIPNYALGILVGTIASDIIFYIPTIISYELKKKHIKN